MALVDTQMLLYRRISRAKNLFYFLGKCSYNHDNDLLYHKLTMKLSLSDYGVAIDTQQLLNRE